MPWTPSFVIWHPVRLSVSATKCESVATIKRAENITDQDLLREVMNTVGKQGRLGEAIRCVVSVSMLTEGWDANTVTHVLGVRAFGTQLLCEQVIGRALRRQSYDLNEEGLFNVEYADILGIPFDFHGQAGYRSASAATRNHPCEGRPPRAGRTGDSLSLVSKATELSYLKNALKQSSMTIRCWN